MKLVADGSSDAPGATMNFPTTGQVIEQRSITNWMEFLGRVAKVCRRLRAGTRTWWTPSGARHENSQALSWLHPDVSILQGICWPTSRTISALYAVVARNWTTTVEEFCEHCWLRLTSICWFKLIIVDNREIFNYVEALILRLNSAKHRFSTVKRIYEFYEMPYDQINDWIKILQNQ